MQKIIYQKLKEELYYQKLDNGLDVYIMPKRGFNKSYATFSTRFGSIDNLLYKDGQIVQIPNGVAHFLEHKLFENEDKDITDEFSKNGAYLNAYTSHTRTSYLFSCTSNLLKSLTLLIDFVQSAYFSDESVEKEKGIINEEIEMYNDMPESKIMLETMKSMYKIHPLKDDIAGTVESVALITKDILYQCYERYYHPENMMLFVIGDFDVEEVYKHIEVNQAKKTFAKYVRKDIVYEMIKEVNQKEKTIYLKDVFPKLYLGIKNDPKLHLSVEKEKYALMIYLDILLGQSSENYELLTKKELINNSFGSFIEVEKDYSYVIIGGDTNKPEQLKEELIKILNSDIKEEDFENVKKKSHGDFLKMLNSLETIASEFISYNFSGGDLFKSLDIIESLTYDDLLNCKKFLTIDNLVTVKMKKEGAVNK